MQPCRKEGPVGRICAPVIGSTQAKAFYLTLVDLFLTAPDLLVVALVRAAAVR